MTALLAKRYLILGETGDGKSTMIKGVVSVVEHVPIGRGYDSETKNVDVYHSSQKSRFAGSEVHDTPGFEDTAGLSHDQILELIEVSFAEIDRNESTIDGMILVIGSKQQKIRSMLHITQYLELFGEEMLQNMMVVINRFEYALKEAEAMERFYELKAHLTVSLEQMVKNSNMASSDYKIPLIAMDCRDPTNEQLRMFENKLLSLQPYRLKNMNQKRQARIQQIFEEIIANKDNYKELVENIIVHQNVTVKRQELKRESVTKERKVYVGPSWKVDVGIVSFSGSPKYATETVEVPVDVIVDLEEQQVIPVNQQNVTKVLKNEELVYWEIAKKKFKEELREQFTAKKR